MYRYRFFVLAALLLCVLCAQVASAQPQPWTVSTYQGNGQLICVTCNITTTAGVNNEILIQFQPLYVKVTDANGNPVVNASVNWAVTSGGQYVNGFANATTTSDANGLSYNTLVANGYNAQNGPEQSTVTATLPASTTGSFTTFYLTQTGFNNLAQTQVNLDTTGFPLTGSTLSGNAGSSGPAIVVGVFGSGTLLNGGLQGITGPIPGVSLRLVNYQKNVTVTCAQGSGADPGSVLTDNTGYATCTPIFSGSGNGQFAILVGGVVWQTATNTDGTFKAAAPPYVSVVSNPDPTQPQPTFGGYSASAGINETVAPATVSSIQFVSGNNQTANSGTALAVPLVAVVTSAAGTPITNQPVTWTVTPAGAAILSNTSSTTDINGHAGTNVTFSSSASGRVSITVSSGGKSATFTATAVVPSQLSGLTKLSGDGQTALVNAAFASPLVVQVNVSSGSNVGQPVQFSVTGPATISASTVTSDSNGRAQVTATAGSTPGTATVTATVGSYSVTFTLTVSPPGPQLTAGSFVNGADFQVGSISPCSIATIFASGLAPNLTGVALSNPLGVGSLNYTVASDTVSVAGAQAPIYNVANSNGQQQITFQVPCSVTAGANVPVTVTVGGGSASVNVTVLPASPGVFETASTINVQGFGSLPIAAIEKRDGSFVSPTNPARQGETVIAFVTGLGPTSPSVGTNALPIFGVASSVNGKVIVGIQNSGVPVSFAQLSEDLIGVYLVAFQIPTGTTGNLVFSIGLIPTGSSTAYYSNPAAIYVQ